ncbi:MAG: hypothetical protein QXR17_07700 [Candidatus Bathyarchaeia archaeon]
MNETSVDEYIEHYKSERYVKYSMISSCRNILRRFVELYREMKRGPYLTISYM